MINHTILYGKSLINYTVLQRNRKTMQIEVHPDMSVVVVAPKNATIEKITERVRKRAGWIVRNQRYFMNFNPIEPPRKYVSGENHLYLGKQYKLRVVNASNEKGHLIGQNLTIYSKRPSNQRHNCILLYRWYRIHADVKFQQIINQSVSRLEKWGIIKPRIQIKKMVSRWGSCVAQKNKMILNVELIRAPYHCIEYVVVHELCHLKYPNHDNKFYSFLTLVMPDWKLRKKRLEKVVLRK